MTREEIEKEIAFAEMVLGAVKIKNIKIPISDNARMREVVDECHILCQWKSGLRCTKNPSERNCHKKFGKE